MCPTEMLEAARSVHQNDEVQTAILDILGTGNEFLQDLMNQFGRVRMRANKVQVACFYELKATDVGKIVGNKKRTVCL
jgi:hypothetical protein